MAFVHKALGYEFHFKGLTWMEEEGVSGPRDLLVRSLFQVSGRTLSREDAEKIIQVFPDEAVNKLFLMYQDSLPQDRVWRSDTPWSPPKASLELMAKAREVLEDE